MTSFRVHLASAEFETRCGRRAALAPNDHIEADDGKPVNHTMFPDKLKDVCPACMALWEREKIIPVIVARVQDLQASLDRANRHLAELVELTGRYPRE